MPRQYNTHGYKDDPLAQGDSSSYQWNGFAGLIDDIFGGFVFGDYDWSSYIMGELLGHNSQQREFEQQEYLMKYDDPVYKMARAKAAGINPNLAAQQIAGSGNSVSAPAVASNTQGVANGLNAISGLANAVTGGKASLAEAAFKNGTLNPTIEKLWNEADLAFQNIGLTDAQKQAAQNYLKYMDEDQYTDLEIKRVNLKRYNQEYKNNKAIHEKILAEIDGIIARKDLDVSQKDYIDALKAKTDEETRWMTWENEFCMSRGIRKDSNSFDAILFDLMSSGGDIDAFAEALAVAYGKKSFAVANAEQQAIEDHSFAISQGRRNGENASDLLYFRVGSWADAIGRASNLIGSNIQNLQDNIVAAFKTGGVNKQGRAIRKELTMILDNAFEAMDKYPEDSKHYQEVIAEMQAALSLTNKELVEWYNKSFK